MTTAIAPDSFALPDDFDPFAGPALATAVPSTAAQREIWAATWMGPEASLAFNEAVEVRLRGALDENALVRAACDVVARHEALRATFSADGTVIAVAEAEADVPVARHDWRTLSDAARTAAWQALRAHVVSVPFDLLHGPLVRFDLARCGANDHVLIISAHHIVCDGWSFGVIVPELAAAYSARCEGRAVDLPPADSFATYASASAAPDARAATDVAERYWLEQFATGAPVLDLPTDRPRPASRQYAAERVDHTLGADLVRRATRTGARSGASQFATLLGAFGILLNRLGGGDDLVVGVPTAGQPACGMPRLVGHLVSMLPVRLRLTADTPARDVLTHARRQVLDAHEHQAVTLGSLLERLPLARDPGRPPLVSVAFNVDKGLGAAAMPFAGLTATLHAVPRCRENFDLFVNAVELDGTVTLECQYNTALYDAATVRAWLAAYERLLEGVAADGAIDTATVGSLPLTSADAREATAVGPIVALPASPLVHRLVEEQAARTPHAIAVDDGTRTLAYGQLDARANQLARHLRARGVQRGAFVGLCLERTAEMFVAVLAVHKAGGAYVPLDPGHPVDRLAYAADDAQIALLLTQESVRVDTPLTAGRPAVPVVSIDGADAAAIAALPALPLATDTDAAEPDGPAYVIYTSGSTGRPKGVVVPHRAVVNLLLSTQQTPGMTADDVVLAITTLSFDIAVSEVILPLTVGARVALASREVAADGVQLRALVERAGVTFIDATPATYRLLLAAGWEGGPHLRLVCTGEAMPRDLGDAICARAGEVWNGYGPTETTVWSTFWRVEAPIARVLIGRPIANTRAYVLDARQQPVPAGGRGELFIGGVGVSSGYLRRPDLTAERFLSDPFAGESGARMYRTGDVVRLLADGTLECLGRNDHQVKLRGYRIELGEIETQLGTCPGVGACAVIVREDRPDDRRLVAYVTMAAGTDDASGPSATAPDDTELRAHLRAALPDYMIPQTFVRLTALPLTPSGKTDRAALPAPQANAVALVPSSGNVFVEPRTPAERLVADLWADALRVGRIGAYDDFFQLGGHSLMAAQVLGRLRRDHGVELPYRRIFEAPTVERFAELVVQATSATAGDVARAPGSSQIPHDPTRTRAPLTALQHRIWRLEELDPATAATHVHAAAWRLVGDVDAATVEGALDDFVRRHDQMRTRFELIDGVPVQVVDPDARVRLTRIDLTHLAPEARTAAIAAYVTEQGATPFDLTVAPLFRATLIAIAPSEHLFYSVRHGLIWDGWSFDIFVTEFCELLEARLVGRAPVLPQLAITLGDFAAWQQSYLTSPEMDRQVAWWRSHLGENLPTLELPADRPRPAQPTYAGDRVQVAFTPDEVDRLTALAHAHGATLFIVLLSAYNTLLHRYSGQRDLLVGTPVRARTRPETEPVIGAFVNTVMLRFDVDPAAPFTDLLGRVRDVTLDAFGNQDMPFELLGGKVPPLRALFSMQDARTRPRAAAGVRVEQVHMPQTAATNDLMLWTMSTADGLLAVLNFSTDLFERATAERFLAHLRTLLLSVLDDPRQAIGRLPLLSADERRAALGEAGDDVAPARVEPSRSVVASIVAAGVARPHAVAVRAPGREVVDYGQLLTHAEAVRAALAASGIGAGARVAVLAGDVATRAAAILGVHAARGAVLLLDVRDPVAYNDAIAEAAGITCVLATATDARALGMPVVRITLDALAPAAPLAVDDGWIVPDDIAFLLHDVDASGRPTTTALPHVTLDALTADLVARLGVSEATVAVPVHSPAAPAAVLEMLVSLAAGATLAPAPDGVDEDDALFAEFLQTAGATLVAAPREVWRELDAAAWGGDARLTALVTDGATPQLLASIAQGVGRVLAILRHGAVSAWSTITSPNDASGAEYRAYLVPLAGTRLFVLDACGEVVAPGVPGWLHVGGAVVDAASRQQVWSPAADPRFVEDPRGTGLCAFRTGERARRRADGGLELLAPDPARLYRGGRVFGVEAIAEALRGHAGVADAAVTIHPDEHGDVQLVACVVPAGGAGYTETELRRHVRKVLPEAAVPSRFVEVDVLARGPDGVPLWERLPIVAPWEAARPAALPTTPSERYVAAVWQDMLGVQSVRSTDKFFDLGGHSLLCFRFIDRVAHERGVRMSPRVVLLGTLEQVAAELDTPRSAGHVVGAAAPAATPVAPTGVSGRLKRLLGSAA
ncbi:MAG TPA: amino acid adenylation domain-containing protein [Gemmatirosa sp.]